MKLATSLSALVLLLTPDLGARFLPGALALSVPHHHGSLIPRQTNTTTGLDNGATCTFDPECLSLFCRGITCVDPSTLVGQVQDGDECFDNASCSALGSTCNGNGVCVARTEPSTTPSATSSSSPSAPSLFPNGQSCARGADCSSGFCTKSSGGVCADTDSTTGQRLGDLCADGRNCASGVCNGGICISRTAPGPQTLTPNGQPCVQAANCISNFCLNGQCANSSSQTGVRNLDDDCRRNEECASRNCGLRGKCSQADPKKGASGLIPANSDGCGSADIEGDARCESGYCFKARDDPVPYCAYVDDILRVLVGQHCKASADQVYSNCDHRLECNPTISICVTSTDPKYKYNETIIATDAPCDYAKRDAGPECWAHRLGPYENDFVCTPAGVCNYPNDGRAVRPGGACSAKRDCFGATRGEADCIDIDPKVVGSGTCKDTTVKTFIVPTSQSCADKGAECWSGKDKCPGAAANTSTVSTATATRNCLPLSPLGAESQACSAQADCGRAFNRTMACVGLVSDKVGAGKCERTKPYEVEETCADSKDCRSLNCENKVCKHANSGPDPPDTPCNVSTTCTTSFCAPKSQAGTVQVCKVPFTAPANTTCTVDEICLSARCINSKCSSTVVPDVVVDRNAATVPTDKKSLSTPVLVGAVVGGVAGIGALASILFFLVKALKGATVATSALHATNAAQQAHHNQNQNQNQDPHQDDHKPELKIQEFSILMTGLDRAGKSMFIGKAQSVLNFIKFQPADIRPNPVNKGVKETKIAFLNAILTFQDQSGALARRPKWLENLGDHHAVCFVVDATDKARINEAYAALQQVLSSPWMTGIPVLVLVNKLDSPQAEAFAQVQAHFNLLLSQRPVGSAWAIMGISAMSGQGLSDAVQWLYTWCQSSKKTIQDAATSNAFSNGLAYV